MRNVYLPDAIYKEHFEANENIFGKSECERKPYEFTGEKMEDSYYWLCKTSIGEHALVITTFLGHIMLMVFSGVGQIALPWDHILDYTYRPKPLDEGVFTDRKNLLLLYANELRDEGKKLDEERNMAMNAMGLEGYKIRTFFFKDLRSHEIKCMKCE